MFTDLAGSNSQFAQRRADYVQLLVQFAPKAPMRVCCCAAELISYFLNKNNWKKERYREHWFYQGLRQIYKDLTCAYSIHVIREAIALLKDLKLLSVKSNDRTLNNRNGQDKTHYYLIHSDRLKAALGDLFPQAKESKSRKESQPESAETPSIKAETRSIRSETPRFTADTHTKIQSSDSSKNSYSLLEEREEVDFVQEEIEDPWTIDEDEVKQEVLASITNTQEILQEQKDSGEDQFSAALEPECSEVVQTSLELLPKPECSEVVQDDLKPLPNPEYSEVVQDDLKLLPKLKSDRVSGFCSDAERDEFYQALLELGKSQGKKSPAAWSSAIIKSISAGEPCQYLIEYREGQQVGSCEKQEWEIAPGQVFPRFISYLTTRLKKPEMSDEQAITEAHQQLKDVNLARSLWESCKRYIAKCQEDWQNQKRLGVQNAYLAPELLPKQEVTLEQVGSAIASLQAGSIQLQGLPESAATAELEPANEIEPETVSLAELQKKLDVPPAQAFLARTMIRKMGYRIEEGLVLPSGEEMPCLEHLRSLLTNPITAPKVERLIAAHPEWGFWIDETGELQDF